MTTLNRVCAFITLAVIFGHTNGVDRSNFKSCEQSSFCRRNRAMQPGNSPFQLQLNTLKVEPTSIQASVVNTHHPNVQLYLKLTAVVGCTFRIQVDEVQPLRKRYRVEYALHGEPKLERIEIVERSAEQIVVKCGDNKAILKSSPFLIDFYSHERLAASINSQGLMKFEHYRIKPEEGNQDPNVEDEHANEKQDGQEEQQQGENVDNDIGAWQENFKSHHDSKPYGPSSIGMDFTFPGADYAYGIPEHADSFALQSTADSEPYRLYNLDVFEYELNSKMALYGSIPFLVAHGVEGTAAILWLNSAETWVEVGGGARQGGNVVSSFVNFMSGTGSQQTPLQTRFFSESGIIDTFIFLGPSPQDISKNYALLTGSTPLPPYFSLAYHQCRWNYNDQEDVRNVDSGFDEHNIPYDVIWLDIEYTDGKKYFTWDSLKFPHPDDMVANLTAKGHRLVVIIDPHIKRENGYFVHDDSTAMGYYVKTKDGNDYEGWCWPGAASYLDFFNPAVRDYYAARYLVDNFFGTTVDTHIWNDMNEPSVFNGPEVTMPKDCVHFGDKEHREVHNMYGLMQTLSTHDGMLKRSGGKLRPFILTRSFFVGSQRYVAVWTGDNFAQWDHLKASIPMCLSISIAGIPFCGADIGGFFHNPDAELFYRWFQAGAFQPFMRSHSHIDTKRREPWIFGGETTDLVRAAIRRRYELLPMWYTLFYEHEKTGLPVMRPIWYQYPKDKSAYAIEDEYLLGDILLVHPVTSQGASEVNVYFPGEQDIWYDTDSNEMFSRHGTKKVSTPRTKIPVYQRGGTILAKKERIRRSSTLTHNDPFTLVVALNINGTAKGTLYIDDGESYSYKEAQYLYLGLNFAQNVLASKFIDPKTHYTTQAWLERVVILGISEQPSKIILKNKSIGQRELDSTFNSRSSILTIRKPAVSMAEEWSIVLQK